MINTLPTWKSQHAANTLSHNDVVRLLGDANEAVKQRTEERDALRDALQFIANHEAPEGSALETVVRFAKLALEVKE